MCLIWIGSLLMRINDHLEYEMIEDLQELPSQIVSEGVKSKKTLVFSPTKDSMAEFNGKKDDWYGEENE